MKAFGPCEGHQQGSEGGITGLSVDGQEPLISVRGLVVDLEENQEEEVGIVL